MARFFYTLAQIVWGLPQTLVGLFIFLAHAKEPHYVFYGAVVTPWKNQGSVSLGMFVFIGGEAGKALSDDTAPTPQQPGRDAATSARGAEGTHALAQAPEAGSLPHTTAAQRLQTLRCFLDNPHHKALLVHEYGHTIQSLIFGPLYLLAIGIPSVAWGYLPGLQRRRARTGTSYYAFAPERSANALGAWAIRRSKGEEPGSTCSFPGDSTGNAR